MRSLTSVLDGMFFDLPLYARIIIIAVFLALAAVFSYKKRFLTISGVITSIVLGFIVFYIGGVSGVAVFLFFFVSASMLSLLSDGKNTVAEKTGRRDMMQVIANGVPAALMLVLYGITHNPVFIGAFAAAIAEAEADTAASSIGMLSSRPPISISAAPSWIVPQKIARTAIPVSIFLIRIFPPLAEFQRRVAFPPYKYRTSPGGFQGDFPGGNFFGGDLFV